MAKGDAEKKGDSLEYWLKDSLWGMKFADNQVAEMAEVLRPLRGQIEEVLTLYELGKDDWSNFRLAIWTAMPKVFENRLTKLIEKWLREGVVVDEGGRKSLS